MSLASIVFTLAYLPSRHPWRTRRRRISMRKTVDVFLNDRRVGSYPVVLTSIDKPTDDDYIATVKEQMKRYYSDEDIERARFLVRTMLD
jgi:hypothetical protein